MELLSNSIGKFSNYNAGKFIEPITMKQFNVPLHRIVKSDLTFPGLENRRDYFSINLRLLHQNVGGRGVKRVHFSPNVQMLTKCTKSSASDEQLHPNLASISKSLSGPTSSTPSSDSLSLWSLALESEYNVKSNMKPESEIVRVLRNERRLVSFQNLFEVLSPHFLFYFCTHLLES